MSELPSVEYELDVLNAFIAAVERPDAPLDDILETAQDHAHAFKTRLETPVRVAFTGFRGSGKSSLINLLIGQDVLPIGRTNFGTPAIIVRHSSTEKTIAGWWDRPSEEISGLDLGAAFARDPDIVSVEIDCDVLKDLWLIDVSGLGDVEHNKRAVFALMRLADVMLWCSNVKKPAYEQEAEIWQTVPARLMRNSLLVLTHSDAVTEEDVAAESQFDPERIKSFADTIPIATAAAMKALRGEVDGPEQVWQGSGADRLIAAVMTAAVGAREAELEKVRRGIAKFIAPAQDRLDAAFGTKTVIGRRAPAPPEPVAPIEPTRTVPPAASAQTAAPAEKPTASSAKPAVRKPAVRPAAQWADWTGRIGVLLANLETGSVTDNAGFIEAAQRLVDDFRDQLDQPGALSAEAGWLIDEFEKANDLLILLQFESADDVAIVAARILVQLSDSLVATGV